MHNAANAATAFRNGAKPLITAQSEFDERYYLETYSDVAQAVTERVFESGWHHYVKTGFRERRAVRASFFDEGYYLKSYPQVSADISAGLATSATEHYLIFGQARGYLPNEMA